MEAKQVLAQLAGAGISLDKITADLVVQGVKLFAEPFDKLLNTVDPKCKLPLGPVNPMTYSLAYEEAEAVHAAIENWSIGGKTRRLWARDASLWTGADEGQWLGWLSIADIQLAQRQQFEKVAKDIKDAGFTPHAPAARHGRIQFMCRGSEIILRRPTRISTKCWCSIRPIRRRFAPIESQIDVAKTLFIVSSKSGSTLEPNIFKQYFFERADHDGSQFFAVTDPGSKMQQVAERDHFRSVFFGLPAIGGRYSALSDFGMVPGAVMGIDTTKFLEGAANMELTPVLSLRLGGEEPRCFVGDTAGNVGEGRTRQSHHRRLPGHSRSRRMAGTVARRIDGQGRQGAGSGRPGDARSSGSLWKRSGYCLRPA